MLLLSAKACEGDDPIPYIEFLPNQKSEGVFIRWNGTVEWNGGMERWNGIVEWNGGIVE